MSEDSFQASCTSLCAGLLQKRDWQLVQDRQSFCRELCLDLHEEGATTAPSRWERLVWGKVRLHYSQVLHRFCGAGGEESERAYQELGEYLFRIARSKLSDPEEVKDLTQTALLLIYRRYETCRSAASFLAWCARIQRNAIINHHRRKRKRIRGGEDGLDGPRELSLERLLEERGREPQAEGLSPEERTELREMRRHFAEAIRARLPGPKQQVVAILHFVYGWKPREIADALGVPAYQVRLNKKKALDRLLQDPTFVEEILDWLGQGGEK